MIICISAFIILYGTRSFQSSENNVFVWFEIVLKLKTHEYFLHCQLHIFFTCFFFRWCNKMDLHSVDHILERIGSLGIYQARLLFILSWVLLFNVGYPYLLLTFLIYEPPWRGVTNSSVCTVTEYIKPGHEHYQLRCGIPRDQWQFTGERSSVITEVRICAELI